MEGLSISHQIAKLRNLSCCRFPLPCSDAVPGLRGMQVGGGGPEAEDEEASGRGQTTLTNFFPARFKGAPQHKGVPLKHAGKPLATPDATKTQGAHERPTSLHGRLNARIEHARACTANMQASLLLEICCLKKASRCRSVGVKMGPAPAPRAETASALRAARLVNASHTDFTQLDPTDAIGTVAEAARTFSKVERDLNPTACYQPQRACRTRWTRPCCTLFSARAASAQNTRPIAAPVFRRANLVSACVRSPST